MKIECISTVRGSSTTKPPPAVQKACDEALGSGWVFVKGHRYVNVPASAGKALVAGKFAREV